MTSVNMQCRNCEIDDNLRAHCEEKIAALDKVWPRGEEAQVKFGEERGRYFRRSDAGFARTDHARRRTRRQSASGVRSGD